MCMCCVCVFVQELDIYFQVTHFKTQFKINFNRGNLTFTIPIRKYFFISICNRIFTHINQYHLSTKSSVLKRLCRKYAYILTNPVRMRHDRFQADKSEFKSMPFYKADCNDNV